MRFSRSAGVLVVASASLAIFAALGRVRADDSRRTVFVDDTGFRLDAHALGAKQKHIRRRLAVRDIVGRRDRLEHV